MNKLKIGYFADGPWAHKTFKFVLEREDIDVLFVVPRFDFRDPVLIKMAEDNNIPVLFHENVNAESSRKEFLGYPCDLYVSMSFNQIIRKDLREQVKHGFINCHAGKLPEYRGRNILNWALINDEKEYGITVHYIDDGIDTGDIIMQRQYPITDQDNYGSLLHRAYTDCAEILNDSLSLFVKGDVVRKSQKEMGSGFYCGRRIPGDELLNWDQDSRKIFNFVRALGDPGVGAHCYFNGEQAVIWEAKIMVQDRNYIGTPGQVLGKTDEGLIVKTKDNCILISMMSLSGGKKECPQKGIGKRFQTREQFLIEKLSQSLEA